ncbi:hypothetical protein EVA_08508 [gut metagenome]|uniref:Uncharacterized protein n=1 Tax=gut metagenome TaxID=749906 RepID=J9GMB6_9ZZZZ
MPEACITPRLRTFTRSSIRSFSTNSKRNLPKPFR